MEIEIINDGVNIRILFNDKPKLVTKTHVQDVEVLNNGFVKLNLGINGKPIYIRHSAVVNPETESAEELADAIDEMLEPEPSEPAIVTDKVMLAKSNGQEQWFSTYAAARAVALSGDQIRLFADLTEKIILKDGVDTDFQGRKVLLTNEAIDGCVITDNNVAAVCKLLNVGGITRTGNFLDPLDTNITRTWTNGGGDNKFFNANNWNPLGAPSHGDFVRFNGSISNTNCIVDFDSTHLFYLDTINNYSGTISLAAGKTLTVGGISLDTLAKLNGTGGGKISIGKSGLRMNNAQYTNSPAGTFFSGNFEQVGANTINFAGALFESRSPINLFHANSKLTVELVNTDQCEILSSHSHAVMLHNGRLNLSAGRYVSQLNNGHVVKYNDGRLNVYGAITIVGVGVGAAIHSDINRNVYNYGKVTHNLAMTGVIFKYGTGLGSIVNNSTVD